MKMLGWVVLGVLALTACATDEDDRGFPPGPSGGIDAPPATDIHAPAVCASKWEQYDPDFCEAACANAPREDRAVTCNKAENPSYPRTGPSSIGAGCNGGITFNGVKGCCNLDENGPVAIRFFVCQPD